MAVKKRGNCDPNGAKTEIFEEKLQKLLMFNLTGYTAVQLFWILLVLLLP